jgi:hypothetical protein
VKELQAGEGKTGGEGMTGSFGKKLGVKALKASFRKLMGFFHSFDVSFSLPPLPSPPSPPSPACNARLTTSFSQVSS